MPAKSAEAIKRKRQKDKERRAQKRAALMGQIRRPESKTSASYRFRLPRADLTKRQMRDQLREAVINTGGHVG